MNKNYEPLDCCTSKLIPSGAGYHASLSDPSQVENERQACERITGVEIPEHSGANS